MEYLMPNPMTRSRSVRFFEIVDHDAGGLPFDFELDWPGAIQNLQHSSTTAEERTVQIRGEDYHGGGWSLSGFPEMLLLSRIRSDYEFPDIFDWQRGTLEALEIAETQGIAETTHVGFFPRNIVGMVRTNTTPGAGSLGDWISNMDLWSTVGAVDVQPLSRVAPQQRVTDVDRARGVKVRVRSTAGQAISQTAPRLGTILDTLEEQFGSVMVEMRIYVKGDEGHQEESDNILAEAQGLMALTPDGQAIDGVEAAQLFYLSREREQGDEINILKDKLAETVEVQVVDAEGRATRRESAARAMQLAYDRLQADLEAAVDRDRS